MTQVIWRDTGATPTAGFDLRRSPDVEGLMLPTGVVNGDLWQSAKIAWPAGSLSKDFLVQVCLQSNANEASSGNIVEIHISESWNATPGDANPGGATGANGAYTGYGNGEAARPLLRRVGNMVTAAEMTTPQIAEIGVFRPRSSHASLVMMYRLGNPIAGLNNFQVAFTAE